MRGFFPTGTNGPFGAAASAGKLLHLNEDQMTDAFGIAGSQSAGLFEGIKEGRMTKRFGAGRAAQSGVMAADLAKLGFTGPTTVREGEWGYLKAFSDSTAPSSLTARLGETYNILETTFKPYPCCKALHSSIDGMLALNKDYHFDPLVKMHDIYEPSTPMAAQFSIPYVVSVALLKGTPGVEAFEERSIGDRQVLEFARKVRTVLDPEIIPYFPANEPAKVTVRMKDGKSYFRTVIYSKGTPKNPMTMEELGIKFKTFASLVIPKEQAEEAIQQIWRLDQLSNVLDLCSLLRTKS
jgi:2-methylcitrate dehydratase PrpD